MNRETQTISTSEQTKSRAEKLATRLLPAVALSLVAGGYGAHVVKEKAEYDDMANISTRLAPGQTPIDLVRDSVNNISYTDNEGNVFNPTEEEIVSEGQEVSREIKEITGNAYAQPGDMIEVTISKNDFGNYKIEADPTQVQK